MQAAAEDDDVEDSGVEDGVYLFRPHTSYISGLRCTSAPTCYEENSMGPIKPYPLRSPHMSEHAS